MDIPVAKKFGWKVKASLGSMVNGSLTWPKGLACVPKTVPNWASHIMLTDASLSILNNIYLFIQPYSLATHCVPGTLLGSSEQGRQGSFSLRAYILVPWPNGICIILKESLSEINMKAQILIYRILSIHAQSKRLMIIQK